MIIANIGTRLLPESTLKTKKEDFKSFQISNSYADISIKTIST